MVEFQGSSATLCTATVCEGYATKSMGNKQLGQYHCYELAHWHCGCCLFFFYIIIMAVCTQR